MRRKKIFNLISALTIVTLLFNTSAIFVHAEDTNLKDLATELSKDLDVDLGLDDSADKNALSAEISKVDEQIKQLTSELNEMNSYIDSSTYAMIQSILEIQNIMSLNF